MNLEPLSLDQMRVFALAVDEAVADVGPPAHVGGEDVARPLGRRSLRRLDRRARAGDAHDVSRAPPA